MWQTRFVQHQDVCAVRDGFAGKHDPYPCSAWLHKDTVGRIGLCQGVSAHAS